MNVGARKLQANWLTLQIYRVVHNCEKLLNYANVLLAKKVGDNANAKRACSSHHNPRFCY